MTIRVEAPGEAPREFHPVRSESRCRIGIDWYDNEEDAGIASALAKEQGARLASVGYNFGYMSIGRATYFDMVDPKTEQTIYAVVTP